jgi:hypothetical protein
MIEVSEARSQVWQLIDRANKGGDPSSLRDFRGLLIEAIDAIDKLRRQKFGRGDHVSFATRNGETLVGVIDRINTKSVSLTIVSPAMHRGASWKVGMSLLTPAQPAPDSLKPLSEEEAKVIAMRRCEEPKLDPRDFTATHLAVCRGKHLIFVETSAHGYFVVVDAFGRPQIVGEEDCGISEAWVTRVFGVDRYGQRRETAVTSPSD